MEQKRSGLRIAIHLDTILVLAIVALVAVLLKLLLWCCNNPVAVAAVTGLTILDPIGHKTVNK